jgi:hypothetical protein
MRGKGTSAFILTETLGGHKSKRHAKFGDMEIWR